MRNFKKVILGAALSMVCTVAFAQQLTVKGVVKQPDGETVIGATVTEKGTTNATVTDLDGNFTLAVKSGAELVISYIGFNTVTMAWIPTPTAWVTTTIGAITRKDSLCSTASR